MSKISLIVLDIDGVFTDGTVLIDKHGNEFKSISFKDIDAYFRLKQKGYTIGFITGEDTPVVDYFEKRFSPDFLLRGCKDKLSAIRTIAAKYKTKLEAIAYCGDSQSDIAALQACGFSFAPRNCSQTVKGIVDYLLSEDGGRGVIESLENKIEEINRMSSLS
jgi:YrbI family 3-deoxy-D-manno-octulosonate 8-phosphate phosphatase